MSSEQTERDAIFASIVVGAIGLPLIIGGFFCKEPTNLEQRVDENSQIRTQQYSPPDDVYSDNFDGDCYL